MGSSLYLSGGVQETAKLTRRFSVSNSFAVGDVVRWDTGSASYVKAQADTATNAEVAGIVSDANAAAFSIVYSGEIDLKAVASLSGFSGPVLFLSNTTAGGLTSNPPSAIGSVVKPLVVRNANTNEYIVTNFLGTQIGGSSTVAIDEIQPVGTIMPFAGSAIPDSWLACDGNSYAIASYPQLYAKLQNSSGDRVPAYGYVATLTGTNVSSVLSAGDYIQYKSDTGAWTGTSPLAGGASNAALLALVLSVTSTTAVVQVVPIYSSTTKNFTISNTVFGGGAFVGTEAGTGNYRAYTSGSAFKAVSLTITGAAITHFNTPDLRGRFALGVNISPLGELESDSFISAISGIYSLGSEGGEEAHILTTAEMPAHKHKFIDWGGSSFAPLGTQYDLQTQTTGNYGYADTDTKPSYGNASDTGPSAVGGNSSHNNMPPYTVVRYIIKATPYTRAAIIDGLDLPYNQLLVSDLRDGSLRPGGNGEDLVFKTNNGVGGTERMRLTNSGALGVGRTTLLSTPSSTVNQMLAVQNNSNAGTWMSVYNTNTTGSSAYAALHLNNNVTNGYVAVYGNNASSHANMTSLENDITGGGLLLYSASANGPILFKVGGGVERMQIASDGRVAIGTSNTLNAKLKISESSTVTGIAEGTSPMVVVNPDTTVNNWSRIQLTDNDNAAGGVLIGAQCTNHTSRYYNFAVNTKGSDGQVTRLFIDTTGQIGIGTSSPSSKLDVNGSAKIGGNAIVVGNLGIGTSNPAAVALDVTGEARSSTSTTSASNAKTLVTKDYVDTGLGILNSATATDYSSGAITIGNLLIQWGSKSISVTGGNGYATVTLPVAFANTSYCVTTSFTNPFGTAAGWAGIDSDFASQHYKVNASSMVVYAQGMYGNSGTQTVTVCWMAIGRKV